MTTTVYSRVNPSEISFGDSCDIKRCRVIHVKPALKIQTPVVTCLSDVEVPRGSNTQTIGDATVRKRRMEFSSDSRSFLGWLKQVDARVVTYLKDNKQDIFSSSAKPVTDEIISNALRETVSGAETFVVGISENMAVFDKYRRQVADTHLQPGVRAKLLLVLNQIAWGKTILTVKWIVKGVQLIDVGDDDPNYMFVDDDAHSTSDPVEAPLPDPSVNDALDNDELDALFCE